jgi:hypothetical protein
MVKANYSAKPDKRDTFLKYPLKSAILEIYSDKSEKIHSPTGSFHRLAGTFLMP